MGARFISAQRSTSGGGSAGKAVKTDGSRSREVLRAMREREGNALPEPQFVAVIEGVYLTQAQKDYLAAAKDGAVWRARIAELRAQIKPPAQAGPAESQGGK